MIANLENYRVDSEKKNHFFYFISKFSLDSYGEINGTAARWLWTANEPILLVNRFSWNLV